MEVEVDVHKRRLSSDDAGPPTKMAKQEVLERKRMDKERRAQDKARRDAEREAERARKDAEKARKEAERRQAEEAKRVERERREEERRQSEEAKRAERERREEERRQLEEAKRAERVRREEERRQLEEAKRTERERREAERQRKVDEKKQEEDEKRLLRERQEALLRQQQRKLATFFSGAARESSDADVSGNTAAVAATGVASNCSADDSSEYARTFIPFCVKPNTTWEKAFLHRADSTSQLDLVLQEAEDVRVELPRYPTCRRRCWSRVVSVAELARQTQLEQDARPWLARMHAVPWISLKFSEDVRPCYRGTWTRAPAARALQTGRNPFVRNPELLNYDYNSEAEWQEGDDGDGEDLDAASDEEDVSQDEEDEEDLAFLDDEECEGETKSRPAYMLGPLVPVVEGLHMHGSADAFPQHEMVVLLDGVADEPIDPFRDYWRPRKTAVVRALSEKETAKNAAPAISSGKRAADESSNAPTIPNEFPRSKLAAFLDLVQGSPHNLIFLVETLRQQFPEVKKKVISETLKSVAQRTGKRDTDCWAIRPGVRDAINEGNSA